MAKKIINKTIEGSVEKYYNSIDIDFYDECEILSYIDHAERIIPELSDCYDTQHVKVTITVEYDDGYVMHFDND